MMKSLALAVSATVLLATAAPSFAGPIENACLRSNRKEASRALCGCIQQVADMTLRGGDQRRAAGFFKDPDKAQQVKMSKRDSDDAFWERYKAFGEQAEALRQYLDTPQQRSAIANNLLYERVMKRISAIGQGTAPTFEEIEAEIAAQDAAPEVEEAAPEASIEEVAQSEVESTEVEASEAVAEAEVEAEDEETEEQEAEEAPADDDVEPDETDNP